MTGINQKVFLRAFCSHWDWESSKNWWRYGWMKFVTVPKMPVENSLQVCSGHTLTPVVAVEFLSKSNSSPIQFNTLSCIHVKRVKEQWAEERRVQTADSTCTFLLRCCESYAANDVAMSPNSRLSMFLIRLLLSYSLLVTLPSNEGKNYHIDLEPTQVLRGCE